MTRVLLRNCGYEEDTVDAMLEGSLKETAVPELGRTPRYLLQTLGTEWGRDTVKDSIWVDNLIARAQRSIANGRPVVVDDLRFPNEFDALRRCGACLVKIIRPDAEDRGSAAHISEGGLNDHAFDYVIVNEGSLADYHDTVRSFLL